MKSNEIDVLLEDVSLIARQAGAEILKVREGALGTKTKTDGSIVTDADLHAEKVIKGGLSRYGFPILSEEGIDDTGRLTEEFVWLVDPLDGTRSFADGKDDFVVMIGLVRKGIPILGVVYQPVGEKLYSAAKGRGAFLKINGVRTKLSVSKISEPSKARYITSLHHQTEEAVILSKKLQVSEVERVASNGVKMGLIAEGRFDILFNPTSKMGEWDTCAPHIIIEEAGGRVSGAFGQELIYNKEVPLLPYGVLATNGALHASVMGAISEMTENKGKGIVLWLTGLSGSGKSTIAENLKKHLEAEKKKVIIVDGDAVREEKKSLGFSREHIRENNFLIAKKALEESKKYDVVLVSVISPFREDRLTNRRVLGRNYHEVFVDCPLSVVEERDVKGLYKKARKGEIKDFIGIAEHNPYERPESPEIRLDTTKMTIEEEVATLSAYIANI